MISIQTAAKFVEIGQSNLGNYTIINKNDAPLATLADFLITDLRSKLSYTYFMNWLAGRYTQKWASGDAFELIEEGHDVIVYLEAYHYISNDTDDEDSKKYEESYYKDIPGVVYFKIDRKKLINIIDRWVDMVSKENAPENIIITQNEQGDVEILPCS